MDGEDIRRLALSLPETVEADHFGVPSFRVAGKIVCSLHLDEAKLNLKLDPEDQANLVAGHPGVVEPVPTYWGRKGWTFVRYDQADAALVETLLWLSWAGVAPKRLTRLKPSAN